MAFASSLDQIGPMTKDVKDCALLLSAIVGHDPRDSTSVPMPPQDYAQGLKGELKDLRVGYLQEEQGVEPDVLEAVRRSLELLETLGARLVPVTIPRLGHALAAYYLVAPAEASSNLARYDGVKYGFRCGEEGGLLEMYRCSRSRGFGKEVKRRIMLGTYALSAGYYEAYYLKACQVRTLLMEDFRRAFELCDVIISPTAPTTAFRLGEKLQDPIQMYLSDYFTIPVNLAGLPALSLPCGLDRKGLPIGLQIIGAHFQEERVLQVAYGFEQAAGYHLSRAQL